ncbi:MAG: HEAT repeat domain-containing protein [Betaproteobacteria bacterium]|nr:HEAT repeat domain-containing protein [Betaproteobacteria bacterium]
MSRLSWLFVCVTLALSSTSVYGDFLPAPLIIEWQEGRLSVKAQRVPYSDLLATVANATGIEVRGLTTLKGNFSIHFVNLTLRNGLAALLKHVNYAMMEETSAHDGEGHIVVKLIGHPTTLDSEAGQDFHRVPRTAVSDAEDGMGTYLEVERLAEQGDVQALLQAASHGDPTTQALAMQRLAYQDPTAALSTAMNAAKSTVAIHRMQAMQVLGGLDNPEATDTLGAALKDHDLGVRNTAVLGLMTHTSPAAIQFLTQALQDSAESIRLLARNLLTQKGVVGRLGARSAVNDSDPTIKGRDQQVLEQMGTAE